MIGTHPPIFSELLLEYKGLVLLDLARRLHNADVIDRAVGYVVGYDRELHDLTFQSTLNRNSDLL